MARILIVEDDGAFRRFYKQILIEAGHRAIPIHSLSSAKAEYDQDGPFDLVLCDGSVDRKGDGAQWALELSHKGQKVGVISREPGLAQEGIPFLPKPFGLGRFLDFVGSLLP